MNPLRAGTLRRQITLQRRTSTNDTFGQQSTAWTTLRTSYAEIEPLTGRELETAQAINAEVTHRITLRYRSDITTALRITYQGRIFNVLSVLDIDTAHTALQLLCSEGLNQG